MLHLRVRLDEPTCVLIGQKMLSGCKISSESTQTQTNPHTRTLHTCVYAHKMNTPNQPVNTVTKQTQRTQTQRAFLIAISVYCSHHTNLYKTEGLLQQDQRKCVSPSELRI